jgi:hypothetical protein
MKALVMIFFMVLIVSCKTELIYMNVMVPAPVTVPADIKKVGIVSRNIVSEASKQTEKIEKVLTLEGKNLDRDAAVESTKGLESELNNNKRFDEVKQLTQVKLSTMGAGVLPSVMDWSVVSKICQENKVDALFALELFDTDSKVTYNTRQVQVKTPLGNVPGIEHEATVNTALKVGWRIYDPAHKQLLDENVNTDNVVLTGRGINPVAAASAIMGRKEAVNQAAYKSGQAYAHRIIPYWIRVTRDYYVKGTSNFKKAKRKAQTGNWDDAAKLWEKETQNPKDKIAGRACYNMAIIQEIDGNLDKALEWARKAYEDYNNKLALDYIRILERRKASNEVLEKQTH